ncbi:MAG: PQQ-dependent sugar dehydrogenase, partial [bacterium]|nr:PQQ-dependent sugar dehydrogenase [bacterium]
DNPFFAGDLNENRAKVYQYGFRNPFRFTINRDSGDIFIGDVGWSAWEEINSAEAGANFGWPYYEGASGTNSRTTGYQDLPEADSFYASGAVATPAIYALNHAATGINAIVMGDLYTGSQYPSEYQGDLFFNDLGQGIVRNLSFDAQGNVASVNTFTVGANVVVQIKQGPDGYLYFVDLDDGRVGKWVFSQGSSANSSTSPFSQDSGQDTSDTVYPTLEANSPAPDFQKADVNGDNYLTAIDALIIANYLNTETHERSPEYAWQRLDINGDSAVTPLDALLVINRLNAHTDTHPILATVDPKQLERDASEIERGDAWLDDVSLGVFQNRGLKLPFAQ